MVSKTVHPFPELHTRRPKSHRLHLWVFASELLRIEGDPEQGDVIRVFDQGTYVGNATFAPGSQIRARIFSREDRDLDVELIVERLRTALDYRQRHLPNENDFRLLFGESDMLPGLVIDKYGDHFVLQVFSAGMERRLEDALSALRQLFRVESVYAKNDFRLREVERLPRYERLLYGCVPENIVIRESGVHYRLNLSTGQKTGFYFDQRITRLRVRALSRNRRVLDVFCYTGGFALNAALGGATDILAIDGSEMALAQLEENARLNGVANRVKAIRGNAFQVLRDLNANRERFDLIILDPPPFIKRPTEKAQGFKGYRDINYQAMKLLNPGGLLVSCSCSHHLSWEELLNVLDQSAQGCGRAFRILERIGAGPDHPVLLAMPETEYLRCFLLELV